MENGKKEGFGGGRSSGGAGGSSGGRSFGGGGSDRGERGERGGGEERGNRAFGRRKVCRYCADKNAKVDYKNANELKYFITERGKIVPRRISGNCAQHQRQVATAIKRGRSVALLPYTVQTNA